MLKIAALERLKVCKPVNRLLYISQCCKNKNVLDIGCYDETAIRLKNNEYWLHGLISENAKSVIGIDSSNLIKGKIRTGNNSVIIKQDLYNINTEFAKKYNVDIIIAGELIEHIPDVSKFLTILGKLYKGRILVLSTPNSTSLMNVLLALFNRESSHRDHIHVFSYKTLSSLCIKGKYKKFEIVPYYVKFTEMYLHSPKMLGYFVLIIERLINIGEWIFPLFSGGYIVKIHL